MKKIDPRMLPYLGEFGITATKTPAAVTPISAPAAAPSTPFIVPSPTATSATAAAARVATTALDPYDYASQTLAGNPARLAAFDAMISEVLASTQEINRQRAERLAGAVGVEKESPSRRRILMPMTGKVCPASGSLAYVWTDLFNAARDNLKKLSDMPPPRYTPGGQIMQWSGLLRWNWKLFLEAMNIRREFLFPPDYLTQHTQFELSAENDSRVIYGKEHAWGSQGGEYPSFEGFNTPRELRIGYFPGRYPYLDAVLRPSYVAGYSALAEGVGERGTVLFTNSDQGIVTSQEEDTQQGNALSRALSTLSTARVKSYFPQTTSMRVIDNDVDVAAWIREMGRNARLAIRWDLMTHIFKSSAFYVLNHIPYWQNQGYVSVNSKEVKEAQVAALNAAWQSGTPGMIQGAVVGILGAANPVMGSAARLLSTVGNVIMEQFVFRQLDPGAPVTFWVRSPGDPTCDATSTIEEEGRKLAVQRAVLNLSMGKLPDLTFLPRTTVVPGGSSVPSTSTPAADSSTETPASTTLSLSAGGGGGGGGGAIMLGAGALAIYFLMRRN